MIKNPILPGFNADPSVVRVGDDYFLATSTFAWFPGVALYRSRDLANWTQLNGALTRRSQLDLRGDADSCGVWAPCLRYSDEEGLFYLLYTDVKNTHSKFFDLRNYLITAPDIAGPWSDPVFLNASGFDPSLFIDTDGRFYLVAAEGGTGYGHSVTVARADSVWGPYEADPTNPILTSLRGQLYGRNNDDFLRPYLYNPDVEIQKPGHADIVDTPGGDWYMVHLGGRPFLPSKSCVLGHETFIQPCSWSDDGWLRVDAPDRRPRMEVPGPGGGSAAAPREIRDDFDEAALPAHYSTLRVPPDESWLSLGERKGWLRLSGRQSLHSLHEQSVVARRIEHFDFTAETLVEFNPRAFQQMAGLLVMQGTETWYYLRVYFSETLDRPAVGIMSSDRYVIEELTEARRAIEAGAIRLAVDAEQEWIQFRFAAAKGKWTPIGPKLDRLRICDEHARSFAGAFVGICCQDLRGTRIPAWFDYFSYAGRDPAASTERRRPTLLT